MRTASAGRASSRATSVPASVEAIALGAVAITARAIQAAGQELTVAQWRVLVIVGGSPDGASVSDVADRLGSELSPASRLIRRLERRGMVGTAKHEGDRRVTWVRLTERGHAVREDILDRRRALLADVLAAIGPVEDRDGAVLARLAEAFRSFV